MSNREELITVISSWTAERIFMINFLYGGCDGKHITALIRIRMRKTKMVKRGKLEEEEACVFMRWFNQHVNTYILLCSHIHQAIVWYDFDASHEFEWDLIYWQKFAAFHCEKIDILCGSQLEIIWFSDSSSALNI